MLLGQLCAASASHQFQTEVAGAAQMGRRQGHSIRFERAVLYLLRHLLVSIAERHAALRQLVGLMRRIDVVAAGRAVRAGIHLQGRHQAP